MEPHYVLTLAYVQTGQNSRALECLCFQHAEIDLTAQEQGLSSRPLPWLTGHEWVIENRKECGQDTQGSPLLPLQMPKPQVWLE